ncbi:hypothetical protein Ancab_000726 [Ancistrocladus abbreviatus]
MAMRSIKDFDLEREPNVSSADGKARRARALNDENVVVGVDERGRNGATSSVDERVDDDSDGEFRVSARESSGASGSGLEENRVLVRAEGGVGVRVLGRDGGSSGNFGNVWVSEAPECRLANAELVMDISNRNVFDFDEENSRMENFGSIRDGADGGYKLQKRGSADGDPKMAVVDGSGAGGVHVKKVEWIKVGYGFEMGDMVWGKVKSHPWWPGHIFNEAFASPSVRRAKRDGHVLVAFFGDSSYGWFDPAELIPYEPHFAEKSQQTNSRNFVKAVEESVDEASRRSALGLSCRCRNPYNFRPTNVHGYLAVDVFDYEPGGIYSVSQIKNARDSFQTAATLSFMKQLALAPQDVESRSIDFIKNKAIALAYRRAIFEEFDDTYAQAFGQEPVHPVRLLPSVADQSVKDPTRGPLSGPLVIAEALGGQKSSTKATKSREHAKRERYLFKRRDEPEDYRTAQASQRHGSSSFSAYEDRSSDSAAEEYVFHKRNQIFTVNDGQVLTPARDEGAASRTGADSGAASGGPSRTDGLVKSGKGLLIGGIHASQQWASGVSMSRAEHDGLDGGAGRKVKTVKRHTGKLSPEQSDLGEKKKRRKMDAEMSFGHYEKQPMSGTSSAPAGKLSGKTIQIAAASKMDSQLSHQKKNVEGISSLAEQVILMPSSGTAKNEVELPQLLGDLQALALNPFHGVQRNRPAILRQVFLKFRSLVFQKSAIASPSVALDSRSAAPSPPVAPESDEVQMINSPPVSATPVVSASGENIRTMPPSKLPKPLGTRADDLTKAGRKRIPSERQEEIAAKRVKKITDAKSSGSENRNIQKIPEMQHTDGKGKAAPAPAPVVVTAPARTAKAKPLKRMEPPQRVEEPTYLMMKYPPGSSLPSSTELRARFIRFGPMDTSGNRIFYKTNTCRVMFLYKEDAQKAYGLCVGNKSVYPNVRFSLKPVSVQDPPDVSQSSRGEEMTNDPPRAAAPHLLQPPHPVQLKSILKKPAGDEAGPGVRVARVRFDMGQEFHARGIHSMDHKNNSSAFQDSGPSSFAMEVACNSEPLISPHPFPPPPHHLPPPLQRARAPYNQQHREVGPRVEMIDGTPSQEPNVDIRQQMLTLLARCHDIVANLVSAYGYTPYHPL